MVISIAIGLPVFCDNSRAFSKDRSTFSCARAASAHKSTRIVKIRFLISIVSLNLRFSTGIKHKHFQLTMITYKCGGRICLATEFIKSYYCPMLNPNEPKEQIFSDIRSELSANNYTIVQEDQTRPWGGFFVIDESQAPQFAKDFFNGMNSDELKISGKLSPKVLIVAPGKRLSWQYHHRRAEVWQVMKGNIAVVTSQDDTESETTNYGPGERIILKQGQRHRAVGLGEWGIVAEIWQHTDSENPSDEDDIVRVQDDFGR